MKLPQLARHFFAVAACVRGHPTKDDEGGSKGGTAQTSGSGISQYKLQQASYIHVFDYIYMYQHALNIVQNFFT